MMSSQLQDDSLVQKVDLEALESNYVLEQKWTQYKKEYEELQSCLEEFPKELSAPILMPLGSKVFVRAQLCNTNEVFIRHGEIFTKQTAYEAKGVCERHIKRCDDMIEKLIKEKNWLSDRCNTRQEIVADSEQLKDIVEPYDPEKEAVWNEIHRQKVKEYKQQLAKQNATQRKEKNFPNRESVKNSDTPHSEKKPPMNDLMALHGRSSMEISDSNDVYSDSDDCSTNESNEDEDMDDYDEEESEEEDDIDDEDEDSKIEIVFTNDVPETTGNFKKKIKKKVSFNNDVQIKEFEPRPEEHFIRRREETSEETENPQILVTEINDIVERVSDTCLENEVDNEENTRPVSRFKAMRNKNN